MSEVVESGRYHNATSCQKKFFASGVASDGGDVSYIDRALWVDGDASRLSVFGVSYFKGSVAVLGCEDFSESESGVKGNKYNTSPRLVDQTGNPNNCSSVKVDVSPIPNDG